MRIALMVPFSPNSTKMASYDYFNTYINQPEVEVIFTGKWYPGETSSDEIHEMGNFIDAIKKAETDGFDAVVVGPNADLGVEEARELVNIPVVGPTQCALHMGLILGQRVAIISPSNALKRWKQRAVRGYGLEHVVSCRSINMSVEQMLPYYEKFLENGLYGEPLDRFVSEAIKAIEEDDASVILNGSGSLVWLVKPARMKLLEKGYDVTCILTYSAAVEIAKSMVKLGITHGRVAYPGYKWKTADGRPKTI
jgi:allantoin racemase